MRRAFIIETIRALEVYFFYKDIHLCGDREVGGMWYLLAGNKLDAAAAAADATSFPWLPCAWSQLKHSIIFLYDFHVLLKIEEGDEEA